MIRSLYAKLALTLTGLLLLVGVLFAVLTVSATRHSLVEVQQQLNRDLARNLVMDRNLVRDGRLDREALAQTFHDYMVINPSIEIYLLDTAGEILAYSADPGQVKRNRVALGPIRRFLAGTADFPLLGEDPRSHDGRKAFSVTPVPNARAPEGFLYVILRGEEFDDLDALIQRSWFLRLTGGAAAVSLLLGLLLGLALFRLLTRRLRRLGEAMDRFRASDFKTQAPDPELPRRPTGDEIDRLGHTFEAMAARIAEQLKALTEKDRLRRELVAQVSHDLRTPLASLHGYLETLQMKEGRLGDAERKAYLDIALRHGQRLQRLVEDLFELAKLDARDVRPAIEPISITDLVQDVVQKYALPAQCKAVRLELDGAGELPLVRADIGLIERVLENLIANAIEHTPRTGSIRVGTWLGRDGVRVGVADSGSGIAPDALPHIFEPRFQGRGADRSHAGLGLAIAKRVLDLHGSRLDVVSSIGAGTAFSFELPVAR